MPVRYIDVTRATSTTLDVMLERRIDDSWNIEGERDLSDAWTGFTQFTMGTMRSNVVTIVAEYRELSCGFGRVGCVPGGALNSRQSRGSWITCLFGKTLEKNLVVRQTRTCAELMGMPNP